MLVRPEVSRAWGRRGAACLPPAGPARAAQADHGDGQCRVPADDELTPGSVQNGSGCQVPEGCRGRGFQVGLPSPHLPWSWPCSGTWKGEGSRGTDRERARRASCLAAEDSCGNRVPHLLRRGTRHYGRWLQAAQVPPPSNCTCHHLSGPGDPVTYT